jgi:hypothetical protein
MIKVRKYKNEDLAEIKNPIEPFCSIIDDMDIASTGLAVTGVDDGVMACGGIFFTDDTDGMVWLKVSEKCKENAFGWARTIKEVFGLMMDSVEMNVYTYVLEGFCQGDRMARSIGLKKTDETEKHNGNIYYKYVVT